MARIEAPSDRLPVRQRGPLVSEAPDFGITPSDIDTSRHFYGAYGHSETEESARLIIQMLQRRGSRDLLGRRRKDWDPFTRREIDRFYRRAGNKGDFPFHELIKPNWKGEGYEVPGLYGGGWIVEKDGKFHITTGFVEKAQRSSPAVARRS